MIVSNQLIQLVDLQPFDGLAGDGTLENVAVFVARVDGQFIIEVGGDMDVGEDALLIVFNDAFAFDCVIEPMQMENVRDGRSRVAEYMDVDIRAVSNVSGADAANQTWAKSVKPSHDSQRSEAHPGEFLPPRIAFMQLGEDLNLFPNFAIGWKALGVCLLTQSKPCGGFSLGGVILGFGAFVHQLGGFDGDVPPDGAIGHE